MEPDLFPHLRDLPYARALLRAVESGFYRDLELASPSLDLGCGDGHFAALTFDTVIDAGLDPLIVPHQTRAERDVYRLRVCADAGRIPFPDGFFASVVSNSVLEHIPHFQDALRETARVLRPGGLFICSMPNENFLSWLGPAQLFDKIGLKSVGRLYRAFFNRVSRHHHVYTASQWRELIETAGFRVEREWNYFSPEAFRVFELGHYLGVPCIPVRLLTGRWILARTRWNLALTHRVLLPVFRSQRPQEAGAYTFFVLRKS